mmetsp:Transcript_14617/g.29966  ORF Transcript_14617/g.29966 Transcript_14617/m.29966 type:complete len:246 (+) Transcript_14617:2281-3018(+)
MKLYCKTYHLSSGLFPTLISRGNCFLSGVTSELEGADEFDRKDWRESQLHIKSSPSAPINSDSFNDPLPQPHINEPSAATCEELPSPRDVIDLETLSPHVLFSSTEKSDVRLTRPPLAKNSSTKSIISSSSSPFSPLSCGLCCGFSSSSVFDSTLFDSKLFSIVESSLDKSDECLCKVDMDELVEERRLLADCRLIIVPLSELNLLLKELRRLFLLVLLDVSSSESDNSISLIAYAVACTASSSL